MNKIIKRISNYPVLITVISCTVFFFLPFKPKPFGDGEYHEGTINLIEFILNNFNGNVRVDKGLFTLFYYLLPYSLVYYFKSSALFYVAGAIFNCLATCIAVKYIFKTFDIIGFAAKTKFFIIALLSLFPIHIYYSYGVLAEPAAFLIVALLVYFWVKIVYYKAFSSKNLFILALLTVALIGVRPNLLPFSILFILLIAFVDINLKSKIIYISTLLCCAFLLFSAEKAINNTDGEFKKKIFRQQILWSRFELRDEPFNWLPQHGQDEFASDDYLNNLKKRAELDSIIETNNFDPTSYYLKYVLTDIVENPALTLRQYSLKFFQAQSFVITPLMKSKKSSIIKFGIHIFINSINLTLILSSIIGIYLLYKSNQLVLLMPLLLLWGWSILYILIFHSEQRYMFPSRPVLIFLSAFTFDAVLRRVKSRQKIKFE